MAVTFCSLPEFSLAFHVRNYCTTSLQWPLLPSSLVTIWFILEYVLQAILPICQAIPLTVNVLNFCLNELKYGDSVCNVSVLIIIPIYLTHTSSSEGNLNESSLFSSLICCIFTLGWVVPGLARFLVVHTSTPLIVFINYYLRGEQYKTTVLLISPFKGILFFFCVYYKKKLGQWV